MNTFCRCALLAALGPIVASVGDPARAQAFDQYISPVVPGYDQNRGAVILKRPRTEYDPLGVRVGAFTIRPVLDEGVSYDSNVLGTQPSVGSWLVRTAPSIDFISNFSRNSIGGSFGIADNRYLDQKQQTHTDVNASLGGTYQIGNDTLTLAGSELYQHQNPTDLDTVRLAQPLGYKVTDLRARYDTSFGRWQFQPNAEFVGYRFDNVVLPGTAISQKVRDRDVYVGGLTTRFGGWPERSLVLVLQAVSTHYIANQFGAPRPDSTGYVALAGVNYAVSGNLQFLVLVGYEIRRFVDSAYPTRASPVAQASLIWTPTGLTTLTLQASRTIEDSIGETTTGVTQNQATFVIDHEYRRNVILEGRAGINNADYGQGLGHESIFSGGGSVTYLLNRNMRLIASDDYFSRIGSTFVPTNLTPIGGSFNSIGNYTRNVALLNLRLSL